MNLAQQPQQTVEQRRAAADRRLEAVEALGERRETSAPGGPVVWRVFGDGDPVLLFHGGAGSWNHWVENIPELAKRHRVIVPDLPGMGESAAPPAETADAVVDALITGIDRLVGPQAQFHFAGFSFGSVISGHVAARVGDRVRSLALIGPVGLGVTRNRRPRLHRTDGPLSLEERWALQRENLAMQMLADTDRISDYAIHLHDRNIARARFASSRVSRKESLGPTLQTLHIPIAAIWGSRDSVYGDETAERTSLIHGLKQPGAVIFVSGAGHWVQFEDAAAVNGILADWLDDGWRRAGSSA